MGTALWLSFKSSSKPEEIFTELISKLKLQLSEFNVTVSVFRPHITITSGLDYESLTNYNHRIPNLVDYLRSRLEDFVKYHHILETSDIEFNDRVYFKSVVLMIGNEPRFIDFVKKIRHDLVGDLNFEKWIESYRPHLSLVYSELNWTENELLRNSVSKTITDFNIEHGDIPLSDCILEIVRCEGPPEEWVSLAQITFEPE